MMNRSFLFLFILICMGKFLAAQHGEIFSYHYHINLTRLENDRLTILLDIPGFRENEVVFHLPAMVPGIYGQLDCGKNITHLQAFDAKGRALPVQQLDINSWKISQASGLRKISYLVDDDWEEFGMIQKLVYRSPGSSFTRDSVFLINQNSVFGYFEKYDKYPVTISCQKPRRLYAATSLRKLVETPTRLVFQAGDYHSLVDNPILFSVPDTAKIELDGTHVTVACYSSTQQPVAAAIANYIRPLLKGQKAYLGGKLPVKDYTFIIYYQVSKDSSNSIGDGLEHAQSTVILMNMIFDKEAISRAVYNIAGHEFFHTIMPLALHSEEIEYYNFYHPLMSKHLWLYEGMTEYFTMHMPVKEHLQTIEQFCNNISDKIKTTHSFDSSLSLNELSRQAITRQDQYLSFYSRAPLVNLCLDIYLRESSGGKYGVQNLINDLLKIYGKHKPFKDEELFLKISEVSGQPGLLAFLEKYINGKEWPPINEYLAKAGILVSDDYKVMPDPNATEGQLRLRKQWLGE